MLARAVESPYKILPILQDATALQSKIPIPRFPGVALSGLSPLLVRTAMFGPGLPDAPRNPGLVAASFFGAPFAVALWAFAVVAFALLVAARNSQIHRLGVHPVATQRLCS